MVNEVPHHSDGYEAARGHDTVGGSRRWFLGTLAASIVGLSGCNKSGTVGTLVSTVKQRIRNGYRYRMEIDLNGRKQTFVIDEETFNRVQSKSSGTRVRVRQKLIGGGNIVSFEDEE